MRKHLRWVNGQNENTLRELEQPIPRSGFREKAGFSWQTKMAALCREAATSVCSVDEFVGTVSLGNPEGLRGNRWAYGFEDRWDSERKLMAS